MAVIRDRYANYLNPAPRPSPIIVRLDKDSYDRWQTIDEERVRNNNKGSEVAILLVSGTLSAFVGMMLLLTQLGLPAEWSLIGAATAGFYFGIYWLQRGWNFFDEREAEMLAARKAVLSPHGINYKALVVALSQKHYDDADLVNFRYVVYPPQ